MVCEKFISTRLAHYQILSGRIFKFDRFAFYKRNSWKGRLYSQVNPSQNLSGKTQVADAEVW
jgi:hypothetical protein